MSLNHSTKLLANKTSNEVQVHEEIFRIDEIVIKHCFERLEMKINAANSDAIHKCCFNSAVWCITGEHNMWWIGGFRPSQLLQIILPEVQHWCSQQQVCDILNFVQTCEQAEYALTQGMKKLDHILHKAAAAEAAGDNNLKLKFVPQQMTFIKQANHVREEFLYQLFGLFTKSQHAQFLLALGECLYNPQPWSSL